MSKMEPDDDTVRHVPRALIIQDEVALNKMLKTMLEQMHMLTFCETQTATALKHYSQIHPDLVMLDIGMPGGWKTLDTIKETKVLFRRPAIIILCDSRDPATRLMGKLRGVEEYLLKSCTREAVQVAVRRAINLDDLDDESR
ncbi:MAG: response regulator [Chloroflexota bacterium]